LKQRQGAAKIAELTTDGITAEYYGFDVTNEEKEVTANITKIGEKYRKVMFL
jgi:hypothetical protein